MGTFSGLLSGGFGSSFGSLAASTVTARKKAPTKKPAAKKPAAKKAPAAKVAAKAVAKPSKKLKVKGGIRNKRLDETHTPFKRSDERPGGPKGRPDAEAKKWECDWKEPYTQVCTFVGAPGSGRKPGSKKTVKVKKGYKKNYNKAYRDHTKKLGKPKFANTTQPNYKKRTTTWLEAQAKKKAAAGKKAAKPKAAAKKAAAKKPAAKKAPAKKAPAKKTKAAA